MTEEREERREEGRKATGDWAFRSERFVSV
jgi:hypothetical protein